MNEELNSVNDLNNLFDRWVAETKIKKNCPVKLTTQEYEQLEKRKITHDIKGTKLHLGCGYMRFIDDNFIDMNVDDTGRCTNTKEILRKKDVWINVDKSKEVKPDKVVDIEKGLPFKDNTFSHIYSYHVLEHVRPDKWKFALEEIYRVAKDGCILELGLPTPTPKNFGDVDHYRFFWFGSFYHNEYKKGRNYYMKFIVKRLDKKPNIFWRVLCNFFPALIDNVYFKFEIVKNGIKK